ncbi:putative glycolipid-binding domain-containing protein [Mesorhizobium sp. SARCC-RB16n]|nr:putative glycolipid-binding domain-containing protein [Mesorhizobium sp. SARCC-RB16n]
MRAGDTLYESRASDFRRELEIDADGLVVDYPDFWRRG